jgi:glycosyltransferase involved in cell wall biosynthesis
MDQRVLVVCSDRISRQMAGPGIRSYELAKALRPHVAEVMLAGLETDEEPLEDVEVTRYHIRDPSRLKPLIARADVIVAQPQWPVLAGWLRASDARLAYDLYDPEPLELLESMSGRRMALRRLLLAMTVDRVVDALHDADFLMCASESQRDIWLGGLLAERLIDPPAYDRDPSLRSLLDVVPFGLPAEPPAERAHASGPRERFGLASEDEVILWNGGIWNWLDAPTAIRAVALLADRRPRVRLLFMGAAQSGAGARAAAEARTVAAELGVLGRHVFFNSDWVPYAERDDWLLESDCAISTHLDHLETRFAFRTRLLDCFWARLPVVCTGGDDLGALVERSGAGVAVAPRDHAATADALEQVLSRGRAAHANALAALARSFAWPRVAAPLIRFATEGGRRPRRPAALARRRPLQVLRGATYRAARTTLNGLGLKDWPNFY